MPERDRKNNLLQVVNYSGGYVGDEIMYAVHLQAVLNVDVLQRKRIRCSSQKLGLNHPRIEQLGCRSIPQRACFVLEFLEDLRGYLEKEAGKKERWYLPFS